AWTKVYAFDAKTGRQLWQYDPHTKGETIRKVCCGIVNRGIAAYRGRIYVGTLDGRLVALDARTGKEAWSTLTIDPGQQYSVTGAPRIAKGLVFTGVSGAEYGVRGYVGAYDAETGKQVWRFYTVPRNPALGQENAALEMAAKTWGDKNDWWTIGGGGTVWDSIVYDPKTDLLYFGTGNGTPWNQRYRDPDGGDNLFLASIVAVKASTGEYVWHYQTTPGDTWDYDSVSPMMTADLVIDGRQRHVLMQPCKNGFMYVLDAKTGELLRADAFTEVNWADGVDLKTGRPRVVPAARYADAAWNLAPGVQGAHGWHSNAFSPKTGLLYIATQEAYFTMAHDPNYKRALVGSNNGARFNAEVPGAKVGFTGYLQAWDPVAAKPVWKTESNQGPAGGALATAGGLVFQG
ncbi:MAG: PQQ-dependent dehydrogenase, methanol/ethanol family, partial [Proteobacteria bacterium]